jgi:heat shock protein HslJ
MRSRYAVVSFLIAFALPWMGAQSAKTSAQAPEPGHPTQSLNLAMGQWRFVAIGNTQVVTMGRQQPYLKFEGSKHAVTGFTGCNRLRGGYKADETSLSFEKVVTTRMACVGETYEPQVLDVLRHATGYKITDQELQLLGPKGTLAVLTRPHQEQTTTETPLTK